MASSANVSSSSAARTFVRQSTGLVRELSVWNVVSVNLTNTTFAVGIIFIFSLWFLFPQANPLISTLICVLGFVPLGLIYAMMVASMPRAGGDYVFVSRVLHPAVGYMLNFNFTLWLLFWAGAFANWIFTQGITPSLEAVAVALHSPGLASAAVAASTHPWELAGGGLAIILVGILMILSTRASLTILSACVGFGVLSALIIAVLLWTHTPAQFAADVNTAAKAFGGSPNFYATVVKAGTASLKAPGSFWANTWQMVPVVAWIFMYIAGQAVVGGEMKRVQRSSYQAIYLTFAIAGVVTLIIVGGLMHTVSKAFIIGASLVSSNPHVWVLPASPTYDLFASLLTQNPVLLALIGIGFVAWDIAILFLGYLMISRYLLAATMDRVVPEVFGEVSDRYHTPVVGIITAVVGALIALVLYTFSQTLETSLSAVLGELVGGYMMVSLAAVLFPYTRRTRDIYLRSPAKVEVFGVPVISILGAISFLFLAAVGYQFATNSAYGVNSTLSLVAVAAILLAGLAVYGVSTLVRRRQGFDLDLAFAEIPPE